MSDSMWVYTGAGPQQERIQLPLTGRHVSLWGTGHSCDSDHALDVPCRCECGITRPYDSDVETAT